MGAKQAGWLSKWEMLSCVEWYQEKVGMGVGYSICNIVYMKKPLTVVILSPHVKSYLSEVVQSEFLLGGVGVRSWALLALAHAGKLCILVIAGQVITFLCLLWKVTVLLPVLPLTIVVWYIFTCSKVQSFVIWLIF